MSKEDYFKTAENCDLECNCIFPQDCEKVQPEPDAECQKLADWIEEKRQSPAEHPTVVGLNPEEWDLIVWALRRTQPSTAQQSQEQDNGSDTVSNNRDRSGSSSLASDPVAAPVHNDYVTHHADWLPDLERQMNSLKRELTKEKTNDMD